MRSLDAAALPDIPDNATALHFGGISLAKGACARAYEALMQRESQALRAIDPNIRAAFIDDELAYRDRIARMIALADIVKVSDEDLDWLANGGRSETLVKDWLEGGAAMVAVTRGGEGVDIHRKGERTRHEAPKAEVVDTVGAGDTFTAGLLAGLKRANLLDPARLRGATLPELAAPVSLALQVAAITVSRAGANPPWQNEL